MSSGGRGYSTSSHASRSKTFRSTTCSHPTKMSRYGATTNPADLNNESDLDHINTNAKREVFRILGDILEGQPRKKWYKLNKNNQTALENCYSRWTSSTPLGTIFIPNVYSIRPHHCESRRGMTPSTFWASATTRWTRCCSEAWTSANRRSLRCTQHVSDGGEQFTKDIAQNCPAESHQLGNLIQYPQ